MDWSRQNQQNIYSVPLYLANRTADRTAINTIYRRLTGGSRVTGACNFFAVLTASAKKANQDRDF